jgi:Kef-type K+ transport system membrane component KefB
MWRVLVAVLVIVVAARAVGWAARRVLQPLVVGEILAGLLLGPSALAVVAPGLQRWLFAPDVQASLDALAQLGLILFMFLVGLELEHGALRRATGAAITVGCACAMTPLGVGILLAAVLGARSWAVPAGTPFPAFAVFLGLALSVTAFPVLARILADTGLQHTQVGRLALLCAAVTDVIVWLLLAVVLALRSGDDAMGSVRTLATAVGTVLTVVLVARPVLRRAADRIGDGPEAELRLFQLVIVGLLGVSAVAGAVGLNVILGAFLLGAVFPRRELALPTRHRLHDLTMCLLLPPFFALVGLRTEVSLLGTDAGRWAWAGGLLAVAVLSKGFAAWAAAQALGMRSAQAARLTVLLNCRGVTELVILSIGLDAGLISGTLFAMLVLVALVSTAMTVPALALLDRKFQDDQARI